MVRQITGLALIFLLTVGSVSAGGPTSPRAASPVATSTSDAADSDGGSADMPNGDIPMSPEMAFFYHNVAPNGGNIGDILGPVASSLPPNAADIIGNGGDADASEAAPIGSSTGGVDDFAPIGSSTGDGNFAPESTVESKGPVAAHGPATVDDANAASTVEATFVAASIVAVAGFFMF